MCSDRGTRGFTLVELLLFVVIVSVGVVGILSVLNLTARASADPVIQKQMLAVAEGLMDEVTMQAFTYCDPRDPGATTATLSAGVISGCTTLEAMGPDTVGGNSEARISATVGSNDPFNNVNDYFVTGGLTLNPITDVAGNTNPNVAGLTAKIQIVPEGFFGITSTATPATMNALRVVVTVSNGRDNLVLESYRTRYAPQLVP